MDARALVPREPLARAPSGAAGRCGSPGGVRPQGPRTAHANPAAPRGGRMIALLAGALLAASPCDARWPLLNRYVDRFVSGDGRVIDRTAGDRSTSEGQAYGMFFALVANDRALFQRLLAWTEHNLAQGDLGRNLPAWHWGKRRDGAWGVIDRNAASDADLWLAYDLLEAGRLWSETRYADLGRRILANAAEREVADVPGFGAAL